MVTKPKFKFIAGWLCVDFVNTVGARVAGRVLRDKMAGFPDLIRWNEDAGVLSPAEARNIGQFASNHARAAQSVFHRALVLREALYRIFKSPIPPLEDLALFNRELALAHRHERFNFSHGKFQLDWDAPQDPNRVLWSALRSSAAFLESNERAALRACPGEECGWLFLDTSRNHSRRWCEMRICGNRAKLRRFRQRGQP